MRSCCIKFLVILLIGCNRTVPFTTKKNTQVEKIKKEFMSEYKLVKNIELLSIEYENTLKYFSSLIQRNTIKDTAKDDKQDVTCLMCRAIISTFLDYRRNENYTHDQLLEEAVDLCLSLNIQPESTCEAIIRMHLPSLIFIIDAKPTLESKDICAMVLQTSNCGSVNLDFSVNIDNKKQVPKETDLPNEENYRVLHITDIHFDPHYKPGSNAHCEEPTCCRSGEPVSPEDGAGFYGDYRNCDAPWHSIVNAMLHINKTHTDIDWIYFTGDVVDHGIWETSIDNNIGVMGKIYQLFLETFPNTPLFPIIGNHEIHPVNVFAPKNINKTEISSHWLYDYIANAWGQWLPNTTMQTIQHGGFYTTLIKSKLRIIALNNNDCYIYNWWTFYSVETQLEQLQWFHDTLLSAEGNHEKVHVLTHIFPGEGSCFNVWAREYVRIIERFSNTIKAQFYGHTHYDEFNLFYKNQNVNNPINVGWNGGSLTPYSNVNPNYIIYDIGKTTYNVLDYESWSYNLTKANQYGSVGPQWFKLYTFGKQFNMHNLTLTSLNDLVHRFSRDANLLNKYWELKMKNGDPMISRKCDTKCLKATICDIVRNNVEHNTICNYFQTIFEEDRKKLPTKQV